MARHAFTHGYGFDPGYGMDLAQLLAVVPPQPPRDLAKFWQQRYDGTLRVQAQPRIQSLARTHGRHLAYDLRYSSTDGVTIGGWLLLPAQGKVRRALVCGHGYGGCELPAELLALDDAAFLLPCFRGIGRSPVPGVSPNPNYHVLHNIQDRQRYLLGGCAEDLWLAVSALLALLPEVAGRVGYSGISFGGGIGALAVPWDARIARLQLQVPTFGHQALRLSLPCTGSGEAVRHFQRHHRYHVMDTLAYYDAAATVQFLRIPALVAPALFDPAVPPPGQFAIYNAMPAALRQLVVLDAGHFDYDGKEQQLQDLARQAANFFMEL